MNKRDFELIKILERDYENKWDKKVNYSIIPIRYCTGRYGSRFKDND